MNPNQQIITLHQPGLNRIEIPSIIGDAAACSECGKAWPCPTIDIVQSSTEIDAVFDYANYRMSQISETYNGKLLQLVSVERKYDPDLGDRIALGAWWHPQWERYVKNRKFQGATTHIMPLQENVRTRNEVNDHLTDLVRTLEDLRAGNIPAYYEVTGADRGRN